MREQAADLREQAMSSRLAVSEEALNLMNKDLVVSYFFKTDPC